MGCGGCASSSRWIHVPSGIAKSIGRQSRGPALARRRWLESESGEFLGELFMRVLITGMDGYLGWSLALYLSARGHEVCGADCFMRRKWVEEMGSLRSEEHTSELQ